MLGSLWFLGTRIEINKADSILPGRKYIIVSNHQSMFDLPLLYVTLKTLRPRYISKVELGKWIPGISVCLRITGAALIDRNNGRQAIAEIIHLAKRALAQNFSVLIFPEGTRARRGEMKSFRENGLKTLLKKMPECEVLPVAVEGTWRLTQHKYGPVPVFRKISILPGKPISRVGKSIDEIFAETETAVQTLHSKLLK
jgi:1-acyl-sn-glycerol-3-phosphate acyltransferase